MRESTSNGPVRSIWSIPSKMMEPISRCVSLGITAASLTPIGVDNAILPWHPAAVMTNSPQVPPISQMQLVSRTIEMVAFEAVQLLDVSGPLQVFTTANETIAKAGGSPPYTVRVVARQTPSVASSAGIALSTNSLSPLGNAVDTLIIAGGPGVKEATADQELMTWVDARARGARRTASVCTGAYLLVATGILDGRRVATHWSFCDDLARSFPALRIEADPIFVRDGSIWTSAGVTAGTSPWRWWRRTSDETWYSRWHDTWSCS